MAGKYYTLQEVMEKLGKTEDQIKDLVKEGSLRQYLDKGQPLFDQTQVDGLSADQMGLLDLTAAGTDFNLQLEETSEIILEPDENNQTKPGSGKDTESEGGFGLSMAGDELASDDTRASSLGINVLDETDDGYKLAADTKGETSAGELDEIESLDADANMESVGSGSGLLDLSLQADDTSLGAVLDDILPAGADAAAGGGIGEAAAAEEPVSLLDEVPAQEASLEDLRTPAAPMAESDHMAAPIPAGIGAGPAAQLVAAAPVDPATTAYGLAMLVPFAALIIATIALGAGLLQIRPGLLNIVAGSQLVGISMTWWIAIGLFVLTLILLAVFGSVFGEKKPASAEVYQKPKKEKPAKKEKKKKK